MKKNNKNKSHKILFIVLICIIGLIIYKYNYFNSQKLSIFSIGDKSQGNKNNSIKSGYELISESCSAQECLFENKQWRAVWGYAKLTGYYSSYEGSAFGETTSKCDAFVVIDGSSLLIKHFRDLISEGNGISRLNKDGNLVLTLSLQNLDDSRISRIKNSTSNSVVSLSLMRIGPGVGGAPVCYSPVDIIDVF